jgi:hypothetical protein
VQKGMHVSGTGWLEGVQKGMREELCFPVDCRYIQEVFPRYDLVDGYIVAVPNGDSDLYEYDAFARADIFPSLVALIRGEPSEPAAVKWVSRYGFLTVKSRHGWRPGEPPKESLLDFWKAAGRLVYLWQLYEKVVNRRLDELKASVTVEEDEDADDIWGPTYMFYAQYRTPMGTIREPIAGSIGMRGWEKEQDLDPLGFYQRVACRVVTSSVPDGLEGMRFDVARMYLDPKSTEIDRYAIMPRLEPTNLLQTLYLQFYLLLTDTEKKICGSCGAVFTPSRPNQRYCSPTCKNTAKSRRWRERQKKKANNAKQERGGENGG